MRYAALSALLVAVTLIALYATFAQTPPPAAPAAPPAEAPQTIAPQTPPPAAPAPPATPTPPVPAAPAGETLNVVGTFPLPGELVKDRIIFYFDKPIVLPQSADGQPAVPPVTIEPVAPIHTSAGPNYIVVDVNATSPVFRVSLNPGIKSTSGQPLNPAQTRFVFQTIKLEISMAEVLEASTNHLVAGLAFTFPVDANALKQHMKVTSPDGQAIPFEVAQGTSNNQVRASFATLPPRDSVITIDPEFTDKSRAVKFGVQPPKPLPQPVAFNVKSVEWRDTNRESMQASMRFTRGVDIATLNQELKVFYSDGTPIAFNADRPEGWDNTEAYINFSTDRSSVQVQFQLPKGFLSIDGFPFEKDTNLPLSIEISDVTYSDNVTAVRDVGWTQDWQNPEKGLVAWLQVGWYLRKEEIKEIKIEPPIENMSYDLRDQSISIGGDWRSNQNYKIDVVLEHSTLTATAKTEEVQPYVGFARESEWYFPRRTGLKLPLKTRNVKKVTLTLFRMFPSNAAIAARGLTDDRYNQDLAQWSEQVGRTEVDVANIPDKIVETPLDLDQIFPQDKKGLFYITANGQEGGQGQKIVLWTNMGVLSQWRDQELTLFAHDLFSLAPVKLAKVSIYSTKNQLLGTGNTGEDGIIHLGPFDTSLGTPFVAFVEHDEDFTLLKLENRADETGDIKGDFPAYDRKAYDAFMYADRDLYRPGETIHAHWLVRTNYGDAAPAMPLVMTVFKPNGSSLLSQPVSLSDLGTGGFDLETQKTFPTGKYTMQLEMPGTKRQIGTYQFSLEEFVPNRIKAAVTIDTPKWVGANEYPVHLNAQHLFGAPAADRKSEVNVMFQRQPMQFAQWPGFTFGNDSDFLPESVSCGQQTTDANGNAEFKFSYKPPAQMTFPVKTLVVGRVFELGGRPVAAKAEGTYFPSDICLGLALTKAADGAGINVEVAAVTPDEQPAAIDTVKVTLERQTWNYYVRRYYEHNEPKWSERFEPVETRDVPVANGRGATIFSPPDWGYYRIRVHSDKTPQISSQSLYSYGDGFEATDPARPSLIKVVLDKKSYTVGDEALVRIESPFDGQGIVTIQGEEIQELIPVAIQNQVGVVRIPITRKHVPNVWIEATVVHAVKADKKQVYPFSSFATANLIVDDPERKLNVALTNLPVEMRPATEARFDVDVKDFAGAPVEAELTLAAVDEGIHGITGYKSPDPYAFLMRPRRPDIRRAHYYDRVAYDFEATAPGGDALLKDLLKRTSAPDQNWIKPVALWSGTVKTDAAGHATVTMQLPEFNGQLRLVVVACTRTASGSVSANMFVRRPYILQTSMPRFLLPADSITCRATVFNNSDNPCKATISWTSGGAIVSGTGSQAVDVPAHGEASCAAPFVAGPVAGQGELKWQADIIDPAGQALDQIVETAPVPVRPPAAYQSQYSLAILSPGETREFKYVNVAETEASELELTLSASPLIRLQESLRYLIRYPYGCVEQTTSTLMPLYLLRQVFDLTGEVGDQQNVDGRIRAGITRLFSMQTPDGGLAMWPGGRQSYPYGSIYALHFLTLVKNGRDIELPEQNYESLRQYVKKQFEDWTKTDMDILYQRAYATYVLALGGDAQAIAQIPRFDAVKIPQHARYLLAAALAMQTQDTDRVKMYLASAPSQPVLDRTRSGTLNSDIRNVAVELLALYQMKMDPEGQAQRAQTLLSFLETHRYGTTQENSFIIASLASYLSAIAANAESAAATVTVGGQSKAVTGAGVYRNTLRGPGVAYTVANTGAVPLYVNITTRGIPLTPPEPVSAGGLKVERAIYTAAGVAVADNKFQQPASYIIDLIVSSDFDIENVIVSDLLPAGFEVENPRLTPESAPKQLAGKSIAPAYVDIRDDRVLLAFDKIERGQWHYKYVVRAVTPGKYQHPSVQAECMYDPSINSRSAIGAINVE